MHLVFLTAGLLATGLGFLGIVLPGLPATPFFLLAAYFFARSNKRLEQWVLELPRIGPAIQDFRAGKGIPKKAKVLATMVIVVSVVISLTTLPNWWIRLAIAGAAGLGLWLIHFKIPTRSDYSES